MATASVVSRDRRRKPPSVIETDGVTATVTLTKGLSAVIDHADIDFIAGYRWVSLVNYRNGHAYAVRYEKGKCFLMHRELMSPPPDKQIDHVDGDGLNNRRSNMRVATVTQNMANRLADRRNLLGLKGVQVSKLRYRAAICPAGKKIHLGSFATPEEASAAYQGAAKVLWGKFSHK
jgi:hypothetical protein